MSSLGNGMTECEMVAMQPENKHNSVVLEHIHTLENSMAAYISNFCNDSFESIRITPWAIQSV